MSSSEIDVSALAEPGSSTTAIESNGRAAMETLPDAVLDPPLAINADDASIHTSSTNAEASTSTSTPVPTVPVDSNGVPLSKNAQKRLAKQAQMASIKQYRRAAEKASKKRKLEEKRQLVKEGLLDKSELLSKKQKRKRKLLEMTGTGEGEGEGSVQVKPHGAKVIIDLGFDELMNDNEIKSMSSQLGYCYAANRRVLNPFDLIFTSFNGRLKSKMDNTIDRPHLNWKNVKWVEQSYTSLYEQADKPIALTSTSTENEVQQANGPAQAPILGGEASNSTSDEATRTPAGKRSIPSSSSSPPPRIPKDSIVYLTGDSPNVLTTIDPTKTYILGGIVDHNRYKSLCLDKARSQGVHHAQLPIGQYLAEMSTRKILTVNQVYEILCRFVELKDWGEAMRQVMPMRKMSHKGIEKNEKPRAEREESANKKLKTGDDSERDGEDEGESEEEEEYDENEEAEEAKEDGAIYIAKDDDGEEAEQIVPRVPEPSIKTGAP